MAQEVIPPINPEVPPAPSEIPKADPQGWMPWATKRVVSNAPGNGAFIRPGPAAGVGNWTKIVISATESILPPTNWSTPPHFSVNLIPPTDGSNVMHFYQHIPLHQAAYQLGKHAVEDRMDSFGKLSAPGKKVSGNSNKDGGQTIQVCLLNYPKDPDLQKKWWKQEKYNTLSWFLVSIAVTIGLDYKKKSIYAAFGQHNWSNPFRYTKYFEYWQKPVYVCGKNLDPLGSDSGTVFDPGVFLNRETLYASMSKIDLTKAEKPPGYPEDQAGQKDAENDDTTTDDEDQAYEEVDMSKKEFRFNPPLHTTLVPFKPNARRLDVAAANPVPTLNSYLREAGLSSSTIDTAELQRMRLGRLVQAEISGSNSGANEFRYGMRFLYNPPQVTIESSRNDSVVLDPRSQVNAIISGIDQNFQVVRLSLVLVRIPDVIGNGRTSDYSPSISETDLTGLKKKGTRYDLEYLYRACNGQFTLEDRGVTSDIGVLIPSNMRLILGTSRNFYGFVESVSYTDKMFSRDMVPIYTEVEITFRRHVDMGNAELTTFNDSLGAVARNVSSISDSGSGGSSTDNSGSGVPAAGGGVVTGPNATPSGLGEGKLKPYTLNAMRNIWARFGKPAGANGFIYTIGGYRAGDTRSGSEHPMGRSLDLMISNYKTQASIDKGWGLAKLLTTDPKVNFIMWQKKKWNAGNKSAGWRPVEDRGSDTHNHLDHIHMTCYEDGIDPI